MRHIDMISNTNRHILGMKQPQPRWRLLSKESTGTRLCQEVLPFIFSLLTGQTKGWCLKLKRVCGCLHLGGCGMWDKECFAKSLGRAIIYCKMLSTLVWEYVTVVV